MAGVLADGAPLKDSAGDGAAEEEAVVDAGITTPTNDSEAVALRLAFREDGPGWEAAGVLGDFFLRAMTGTRNSEMKSKRSTQMAEDGGGDRDGVILVGGGGEVEGPARCEMRAALSEKRPAASTNHTRVLPRVLPRRGCVITCSIKGRVLRPPRQHQLRSNSRAMPWVS